MNLIRLATLYLRPSPEGLIPINMRFGSVDIRIIQVAKFSDALRLLVAGEQKLQDSLSTSTQGVLEVPKVLRLEAERAIEHFARVVAVREGSSWELKSPALSIALSPDTDEERKSLENAVEIESSSEALVGVKPKINLPAEELIAALKDRLDGVALLSEALLHEHAGAQFREYLRVFERAFKKSSSELVAPLAKFLMTSDQGYSEDEVKNWLVEVRHPATHADVREVFYLDADVRPIIFRVRQAAYDVLMNKASWRDPSFTRRNTWKQAAWTISPSSNTLVTEEGHDPFQPQIQALDEFGVFPIDFHAEIRNLLPSSWWVVPPTKGEKMEAGT